MMDRRRWLLAGLALAALLMIVDVSLNGVGFIDALSKGLTMDVQQQQPTAHAELQHTFSGERVDELYLDARGGTVTITGADIDVVTAEARVAIYAGTDEAAAAYTETLRLDGTVADGVLQPALRHGKTKDVSRATVHWTITVPYELAVRVDSGLALVGIFDVDNAVTVGGSGSVSAARVGSMYGTLRGGALEVEGVKGDVDMTVSFGAAKIAGVGGDVRLSGDNGAMQIVGVGGDVTIGPTSAGAVWVGDVQGSLTVEQTFGALVAVDTDGPVTATLTAGDATITPRTAAPIRVRGDKGSITVRMPEQLWPQYTLSIDGSRGSLQRYEELIAAYGQPEGPNTLDVTGETVLLDVLERGSAPSNGTMPFLPSDEAGNFGWKIEMNVRP